MGSFVVILELALGLGLAFYLRHERRTLCAAFARRLAEQDGRILGLEGSHLEAVSSLRTELLEAGALQRGAQNPAAPDRSKPSPSPRFPSRLLPVEPRVVSVTRDDHPDHTRPTVVSRAADASLSDTLLSAGVAPSSRSRTASEAPLEGPDPTQAQRQRAARLHGELVAREHGRGNHVGHCHRPECRSPVLRDRPSNVDSEPHEHHCACGCVGCAAMKSLFRKAYRQVMREGPVT